MTTEPQTGAIETTLELGPQRVEGRVEIAYNLTIRGSGPPEAAAQLDEAAVATIRALSHVVPGLGAPLPVPAIARTADAAPVAVPVAAPVAAPSVPPAPTFPTS